MIIIYGIPNCLPCKLLHNKLLRENIHHHYCIVDGEDGVYYPQVIVNGTVLEPRTVDEYVKILKGE